MWKMWKTSAVLGGKRLENRGKPKSFPQRFPQSCPFFVENSNKTKNVRFAQISLFMAEKWEKEAVKNWKIWLKNEPKMENRRGTSPSNFAAVAKGARGQGNRAQREATATRRRGNFPSATAERSPTEEHASVAMACHSHGRHKGGRRVICACLFCAVRQRRYGLAFPAWQDCVRYARAFFRMAYGRRMCATGGCPSCAVAFRLHRVRLRSVGRDALPWRDE